MVGHLPFLVVVRQQVSEIAEQRADSRSQRIVFRVRFKVIDYEVGFHIVLADDGAAQFKTVEVLADACMLLHEGFVDFAPLGEVERQFVNFIGNAAQVRAEAVRQDAGGFGGNAVALLFSISGNPFGYFVVVKFGRFKIDTVGRTF